jgi:FMN-dependent NADH-azoreductase
MPTLLHIDSSPLSTSVSRELGTEFVKTWLPANASGTVIYRDLANTEAKPVDTAWIYAAFTPEALRTPEQNAALALSDELIAELEQADEYVIGVAMHNFSIPSVLKLWIDQIARKDKTFAYSDTGPQGLLLNKKVTLLIATGGKYDAGTAMSSYNFVEPYLRAVLGFLGVKDVTVVTAGGTAALMSPDTDRVKFLEPSLELVRSVAA